MTDEEVQLGSATKDDDYEVVPVGPMRKLERRMDELEQTAKNSESDPELIRDVLDIMKSNQKVVNDMTESTHQLKNQVEDLTHKMDEVVENMNSFMDLLKDASEMDMEGEVVSDMESRIAESIGGQMDGMAGQIQESNQHVAETVQQMNQSMESLVQEMKQNSGMQGVGVQNTQQSPAPRQNNRGGVQQREGAEISAGNQQSGSTSRSDSSGMGVDRSGGDERMEKLREKFENVGE
jgi:methyl-accepting chemotaxis protein